MPTARLASHLQHRLATVGGRAPWIGVEIFTVAVFAREILTRAGRPVGQILSVRLREALVRRVLRLDSDNRWARFADYKTDRETDGQRLLETYRKQMAVYADAVQKAYGLDPSVAFGDRIPRGYRRSVTDTGAGPTPLRSPHRCGVCA